MIRQRDRRLQTKEEELRRYRDAKLGLEDRTGSGMGRLDREHDEAMAEVRHVEKVSSPNCHNILVSSPITTSWTTLQLDDRIQIIETQLSVRGARIADMQRLLGTGGGGASNPGMSAEATLAMYESTVSKPAPPC